MDMVIRCRARTVVYIRSYVRSWLVCRSFKQDIDKNICTLTMSLVGHRHRPSGLGRQAHVQSPGQHSHRPERHKQLESRTQGPSTARIQGVRYSTRQESLEPVATTALGRRMVAVCRLGAFLLAAARHCDGNSSTARTGWARSAAPCSLADGSTDGSTHVNT